MVKLARLSATALLGLLLAIALLVPGAFVQRVDAHHGSATLSANRTVVTAVFTGANQAAHTTSQQAMQPLSMNWHWRDIHSGWGGGGWWGGWGGWDGWSGGWWGGCGC